MKKLLSMVLLLATILAIFTLPVFAEEPEEVPTTINFQITFGDATANIMLPLDEVVDIGDGTYTLPAGLSIVEDEATVIVILDDAVVEIDEETQTVTVVDRLTVIIIYDEETTAIDLPKGTTIKTDGTIITPKGEDTAITMPDGEITVVKGGYMLTSNGEIKWNNPFNDVVEGQWFYNTVEWAYTNGCVAGMEDDVFAPAAQITRAMFLQILFNIDNPENYPTTSPFEDVPANVWYTNAVAWAAEEGIVSGIDATHFAPNTNITREQIAKIIHNYIIARGFDGDADTAALDFADTETISEWAFESVAWCKENGIIYGKDDNVFDPAANASRAEATAMLHRLAVLINE